MGGAFLADFTEDGPTLNVRLEPLAAPTSSGEMAFEFALEGLTEIFTGRFTKEQMKKMMAAFGPIVDL
jgi:hypothetical protein